MATPAYSHRLHLILAFFLLISLHGWVSTSHLWSCWLFYLKSLPDSNINLTSTKRMHLSLKAILLYSNFTIFFSLLVNQVQNWWFFFYFLFPWLKFLTHTLNKYLLHQQHKGTIYFTGERRFLCLLFFIEKCYSVDQKVLQSSTSG